jgi:hypothetical protein
MPAQYGLRLNHSHHIELARPQPNHPNRDDAIAAVQSNPRQRVPRCKVQLMPKKQYFGFKSSARLD